MRQIFFTATWAPLGLCAWLCDPAGALAQHESTATGPQQPTGPRLTTTRLLVGTATEWPSFVTAAPGDYERLFIVQLRTTASSTTGHILIYNLCTGALNPKPFLTITGLSDIQAEQGLLGLAFAPDYARSGRFYVQYTAQGGTAGTTHIARGTVSANPDIANATLEVLLAIPKPYRNHNGGWIGFGQDGYLYAALGDGGSGNDPQNRAQDLTIELLGKILRLDVSGNSGYAIPPSNPFVDIVGDDEIWAYGLRNPWRCSFDRVTDDLYIADVGQSAREELDFQTANGAAVPGDPEYQGGRNYGWRCMEGELCTGLTGCTCGSPILVNPIHTYINGGTPLPCAIIGGYVYRGAAMPGLHGAYFFADFCDGLWSLRYDDNNVTEFTDRKTELAPDAGEIISPASFGEDAAGELHITDLSGGEVFKIIPACPADLVAPWREINVDDLLAIINAWGPCPMLCPPHCAPDIAPAGAVPGMRGDCIVNVDDLLAVINSWGPCR
jgi:hypothetical protein